MTVKEEKAERNLAPSHSRFSFLSLVKCSSTSREETPHWINWPLDLSLPRPEKCAKYIPVAEIISSPMSLWRPVPAHDPSSPRWQPVLTPSKVLPIRPLQYFRFSERFGFTSIHLFRFLASSTSFSKRRGNPCNSLRLHFTQRKVCTCSRWRRAGLPGSPVVELPALHFSWAPS